MTDAPQEASRSDLAQRLIAALGQSDRVLVERKNAVGEYDVEIFQADSARAAADLVPDWSSDMDAAPKDGMPVLVAAEDCNVGEASFIDGEWWWSSQACAVCWPVESSNGPVTHWMPLPAPPKEGE